MLKEWKTVLWMIISVPPLLGAKINRHPGRDVHKPVSKCLHDVLKIEKHKRETRRMALMHTGTHMRRTGQTPLPCSQGLPAHTGFYVSSASLETALRVSLLPASKLARVFPEPFS